MFANRRYKKDTTMLLTKRSTNMIDRRKNGPVVKPMIIVDNSRKREFIYLINFLVTVK